MIGNSKTLIDSLFSNAILYLTISPHLGHFPQFLIAPNIFFNSPSSMSNIYEKDWSKCDQENFIFGYYSINWDLILCIYTNNIDKSFNNILVKFNSLIQLYVPGVEIRIFCLTGHFWCWNKSHWSSPIVTKGSNSVVSLLFYLAFTGSFGHFNYEKC